MEKMHILVLALLSSWCLICPSRASEPALKVEKLARASTWNFCPDGKERFKRADLPRMENDDKRVLSELLELLDPLVQIEYRSSDWKGATAAERRVREVLKLKPRYLAPAPLWADGEMFGRTNIIAVLGSTGTTKFEIVGTKVCVKDTTGRFWFFRTGDVWK